LPDAQNFVLAGRIKKLGTDFDEIFWVDNFWRGDGTGSPGHLDHIPDPEEHANIYVLQYNNRTEHF